jgi:hypothetical protein
MQQIGKRKSLQWNLSQPRPTFVFGIDRCLVYTDYINKNGKWLQKHNCSYTKRPSCFPINYIPVTVIPKLLMIRTENPDLPILNKFSIFLLTVEKKLYCILVISAEYTEKTNDLSQVTDKLYLYNK